MYSFRDWVGGRYSVWSAVGISCVIGLGGEAFEALLAGAAAMDGHFQAAPLASNAPVLLALAHIFNRNGLGRPVRAVVPYAQRLRLLPNFLQQLEMESNGKRVTADGAPAPHPTATAVFGDAGTNVQHAFFQLMHQGTDVIPVDFIAVSYSDLLIDPNAVHGPAPRPFGQRRPLQAALRPLSPPILVANLPAPPAKAANSTRSWVRSRTRRG